MRTINAAGVALIQGFETCRLVAYQDERGIWTIGWGHTAGVKQGDTCTQGQADAWFLDDLEDPERIVDEQAPGLSDNQFSAIVSFVYNVGSGSFLTSHLLKYLQRGDFSVAADELLKWDHVSGKVSDGLTRRRQAERALFLTP
jgi:lysozyme